MTSHHALPEAFGAGRPRRVALVLLAAYLAAGAGAQERPPTQTFEIRVWAIRASKTETRVSRELRAMARELRRRFNYKGFVLERKSTGKAAAGKAYAAGLVGNYKARVTPVARKGDRVTLRIEVLRREGKQDKSLLKTTATIRRARFQLLGGWRIDSKSDDVLIVGISAR